ncbi:hypothetical protein [Thiolapillus sp.]|uniref:hypothetical protein n=2 Tax=Thiolapillus sp. TaxID=2017437 RepID=UPI003AF754DF
MKSRIIIAGLAAFATPASAINIHQVKSLADHGPNTLRAAVASATAGDRITFAPWLYDKIIPALGKTVWKLSKIALSTTADDGGHYGT